MHYLSRCVQFPDLAYAVLASFEGDDDPRGSSELAAFLDAQCELVARCVEPALRRGAIIAPVGELKHRFALAAETAIYRMHRTSGSLSDSGIVNDLANAWDNVVASLDTAYREAATRANGSPGGM